MSTKDQPTNNIIRLPLGTRGQRVVRMSSNNILVADNSLFGGFQHLASQAQDRPDDFTETARRQLADTQIDYFVQELRKHNPNFDLDKVTRERIQSLAADPTKKGPADVISAVQAATSTAVPAEAKSQIDAYLKNNNIAPEEYYAALAKVGAGMSPDQVMAAYRAIRAKESSGMAADGSAYGYNSVAVANFSSNNGVLSGMTPTFYREHFQSYYGATPQGQFTATRVANVLAANEGLSGAALVARTKEVGHDTGVRLGLDTNKYAPKVANIGKKYSEPAITYKEMLDKAIELQKQGNQAAADEMSRQAEALRKQQEEKAKREDPKKAPDVGSVYSGVLHNAIIKGYKPSEINAAMLAFHDNPSDPKAVAQHEAMLKKVAETPQGAAAVEAYRAERAKVEELKKQEQAAAGTAVREDAKDKDDLLASLPPAQPDKETKKADAPSAPASAETSTKTAEAAGAIPPDKDKKVEPTAKKDEPPKKVATAANGRAVGPV